MGSMGLHGWQKFFFKNLPSSFLSNHTGTAEDVQRCRLLLLQRHVRPDQQSAAAERRQLQQGEAAVGACRRALLLEQVHAGGDNGSEGQGFVWVVVFQHEF